jgi:6-phosphofructokinase 2
MIITVTLNPCIDKSTEAVKIIPDSKLRCTEVKNEPGGGGINVSKALKKLDTISVALFAAGGYNGEMLKGLLQNEGIDFLAVNSSVETRENWVVLESSTNSQFRFTFPGRSFEEEIIKELIDQIRSFSPSYVVASGSLPPGLPPYFYGLIVKTAQAVNARCIVDTSGEALTALKNKKAYLIKPNIGELCKLLGVEWLDPLYVPDAAQQVIGDGYAEIVAVSMGPKGAWLVSKDEKHFAPAPEVEKQSTVGAGDSMVAGITYMLQKQQSLKDAVEFGVSCGTAATMNPGTNLFNPQDVWKLYHHIQRL